MKCQYCGAVQPVPDLAARQQALLQQRQAELAAQQRQAEEAREARREVSQQQESAERRRGVRWGRVTTLAAMLVTPAILSVTVFDVPARLGFGGAGADRLALIAAQLVERGCRIAVPASSQYVAATVTQLVRVETGCVRAIAAGGPHQGALTVRIFDRDGAKVATSESSSDPQIEYCPTGPGSLRYEVVPGLLDKGRLTHSALICPARAPDAASPRPASRSKKPAPR